MVYVMIFNNVIEALNLFANKYVAESQLPAWQCHLPAHTTVLHRVLPLLAIGNFHHIM
jgi:hypothetical protein